MKIFNAGWYLIYTKPRHEKKVHAELTEININSFLPLTKKLRTWHDRKKYIDEPLFPSYVFVYLDDIRHYYEGVDIEGALHYVRYGKEIARVQDSIINNLRLVAEQKKDIEVSAIPFQPGRKLVISQGALTGLSCEVVRYKNTEMLLVRVDLLQRNLLISLPVDHLITM